MGSSPEPRPGDVIVDDEGTRYVIDGSYFGVDFDDGGGKLCLAVSNLMGGRAYRVEDHVSASGGPCPFVPIDALKYDGTTEQRFWRFKNGRRVAHNGEEYMMTVNMFRWRK